LAPKRRSAIPIDDDIIIAAPVGHDWAKTMVFQWNEDGTEFTELDTGGNGKTDNYGVRGTSKTGGHHIIGVAETMARKLPPAFVVTQASAHGSPTSGNEFQVVNWIRAASILTYLSAERLQITYANAGLDGVAKEIANLGAMGLI
jgi:hypothetical protein